MQGHKKLKSSGHPVTSIRTNAAAITALRMLNSITAQKNVAQRQISTGLRVGSAADGASYWSIATRMRSDMGALSAVKDSLQIGGAMTDTAYQGVNQVIDILGQFKNRLVAASNPGADKSAIQQELSGLSNQAVAIAKSASFNGVNWLATDLDAHLEDVDQFEAHIPAGLIRSQESVSIATIDLDLKRISLVNAGGGGVLQKDLGGLGSIGGFRETNAHTTAHNGHEDHVFTGPATFGDDDSIVFELIVDRGVHSAGATYTISIDKALIDVALGTSDGVIGSAADMRKVLERAFDDGNVPATAIKRSHAYWAGDRPEIFEIGSLEDTGEPGSSIAINVVSSDFGPSALGLGDPPKILNHDNMYPLVTVNFDEPFSVIDKAAFYFDVQVGTGPRTTVTVDRATVDAALGTSDGYIGTAADFATVLSHAIQATEIAVTVDNNLITFGADPALYPEAGNRALALYVGNVRDNLGYKLQFDLTEVDITKDEFSLKDYLTGVEHMLNRAVTAGGTLGAHRNQIDMQHSFVGVLADMYASGISSFVDADMEEVSTRLMALQAQEELAIKSLSIANSNFETVLQLFRPI